MLPFFLLSFLLEDATPRLLAALRLPEVTGYMEMNAMLKVDWRSALQAVEDEKKDFERNPIIDWEPVETKF